jgi:hypothetical protein
MSIRLLLGHSFLLEDIAKTSACRTLRTSAAPGRHSGKELTAQRVSWRGRGYVNLSEPPRD